MQTGEELAQASFDLLSVSILLCAAQAACLMPNNPEARNDAHRGPAGAHDASSLQQRIQKILSDSTAQHFLHVRVIFGSGSHPV